MAQHEVGSFVDGILWNIDEVIATGEIPGSECVVHGGGFGEVLVAFEDKAGEFCGRRPWGEAGGAPLRDESAGDLGDDGITTDSQRFKESGLPEPGPPVKTTRRGWFMAGAVGRLDSSGCAG